jgi:hypothetical protein
MSITIKVHEQKIEEMALIGSLERGYEVVVWTNDGGNVPHFHVRDIGTHGKDFESCAEIRTNHYFLHKPNHVEMPRNVRKMLYEFLCKPAEDGVFKTNYAYVVYEWNRNNSNMKIPFSQDAEVPDYMHMQPQEKR